MKLFVSILAAIAIFSVQAQEGQYPRASENDTEERYDLETGKCTTCQGMKKIENMDYNKKKMGSRKIITCPACKGKGGISQSLKSIWGITLYKKYSADGGEKQKDGSVKFSFTPKKQYRKFTGYNFSITPESKTVFKISAQYHAESEEEANRELDIFVQQMKKKFPDKLFHTMAYKYQGRATPGFYYYDPDKSSRMEILRNMDAVICISISIQNEVKIIMYSNKFSDILEEETKNVSSSDSDIDAL